jgi:hypothetical protein
VSLPAMPGAGLRGRCGDRALPRRGQHVTRGGYALQCGDGGSGVQAGWCRCSKCQSLTFTGNGGGVCAAGGAHETGASAPYALTHGNVSRG